MPAVEPLIFLVIGVVAVNGIAGRIGVPAPILLLVAGVGVSFIPGVPEVQVEPEVVLTVLIPPLLFAAATEASVVALRGLLRSITQLAVGMVLVTAFAVLLLVVAEFVGHVERHQQIAHEAREGLLVVQTG